MRKKRFIKKAYWLVLSLLLAVPNFFYYHFYYQSNERHRWEQYDPNLQRISSVNELVKFTDSAALAQNIHQNTLEYVILLNRIIKRRFYHGYSYYALSENWMAAFAGKFIWDDLSAIVLPDDILKYPMAACSQQSVVLMECLRQKGIGYRKVIFDHHFAVEANVSGWHFFDPDMEPDFSHKQRGSFEFLLKNKMLLDLYKGSKDPAWISMIAAHHYYGRVNAKPAPNASLFHSVTKIGSKTLWLFPLTIFLCALFAKTERKRANLFVRKALRSRARKAEVISCNERKQISA